MHRSSLRGPCTRHQAFSCSRPRIDGAVAGRPRQAAEVRPTLERCRTVALAADAVTSAQAEDKWIARSVVPLSPANLPEGLQAINHRSLDALRTMRMPTTRDEEYRYTDMSLLLKSNLQASDVSAAVSAELLASLHLPQAASSFAVLVNGVLRQELSKLSGLPKGVYVGGLQGAPAAAVAKMNTLAASRGGPFSVLNGAAACDALVVVVPKGVEVTTPLHVLYVSTGGAPARATSTPRTLVHADSDSVVEVVEEYVGGSSDSGHYFTCGVAEFFLEENAQVKHGYVQREHLDAIHVKSTLVSQAASSRYSLTEATVGGALTRHDVGVQQVGPETHTSMRHFLIAGSHQLHDLHSKLQLDHPRGVAEQLHKCIVAHSSGRGVFDGNVKVNKLAQQTDAQQLSRNLLLVPRATVNVKPNLQIIADDVKCTHGCTVSDLQEEELFYFRARGIDAESARRALVSSFGAEVTEGLTYKELRQRIQADVAKTLSAADISATLNTVATDEDTDEDA